MNKPLIWKMRGVWYCGRPMSQFLRIPVAPLYGDGSTPALAFADWEAQRVKLREFHSLIERSAPPLAGIEWTENAATSSQPKRGSGWSRFFRRKRR